MSSTRAGSSGISLARQAAFSVVRRVFEQGAYADRALIRAAAGLDSRERALATALAYGTVQRKDTLDYVAAQLSSRPPNQLDAPVLAALRLGLYQLLYMDRVADHAAVHESVELAKQVTRGGASLVNAVLRRAANEGPAILDHLEDGEPSDAALVHSVPLWLAEQWFAELGAEPARRLLRVINQPAESAVRVNTLLATPEGVLAALPVAAHPAPDLPEGLVLEEPFDAHGSELFARGALQPQSRGSMLVSRVLNPNPVSTVLDLCAAPGGKTTHLAALMENRGRIVAVERHRGRAQALRRTCRRLAATCVEVQTADAAELRGSETFDAALVDPPCSGLGTLQSRPDLRWRVRPDSIAELAELQSRIVSRAARAIRPGGTLVYSVCTISAREGEAVVDGFLDRTPGFGVDDLQTLFPRWAHPRRGCYLQLLPDRDRTDGFFIARLRRR